MLYVVSTPIGNLDDLSHRQARTIMNSELVLAEDTRSAQILIDAVRSRFQPLPTDNPKIVSYYKEREFEKLPWIIEQLKEGKEISLISENGTPLVSDPGYLLVKTAIKENIPLTVVPGSSAVITALVHSGFNPNPKAGGFAFMGFFPRKESESKQMIKKLIQVKEVFPDMLFVFYESPQRINASLRTIKDSGWDPDIAVCREMTKKFEEVVRGKAAQLMDRDYKGEISVVIK